jgi:hypothetical protein
MNATERELWLALADNFAELQMAIEYSRNDINSIQTKFDPKNVLFRIDKTISCFEKLECKIRKLIDLNMPTWLWRLYIFFSQLEVDLEQTYRGFELGEGDGRFSWSKQEDRIHVATKKWLDIMVEIRNRR